MGAFAVFASCNEIARALCHPLKFEMPTYRALPEVYAKSKAESVSSSATFGSQE